MMSQKNMNDELDLSLTGSQISTISARSGARPASAKGKRPALGPRDKKVVNGCSAPSSSRLASSNNTPGKARQTSSSQNIPVSGRSDHGTSRSTGKTPVRDDFMALFESGVAQPPKIMKPQSQVKKAMQPKVHTGMKTAWGSSTDTARTLDSEDGLTSRPTAIQSRFSHSVFQPTSARSSSTLDDEDDYYNRNYEESNKRSTPRSQGRKSARDEVSLNLGQRSPHAEDVNFNFNEHRIPKEDLNLSRNSLHVDRNLSHLSGSSKGQKLNSIANNMTSQAMSPGTKTPLGELENSYQNIKHKTVNQVRESPQNVQGRNIAEDYIKTCNMAATKIQRWFRRHCKRKKSGEAAIKRMLDAKRAEKEEELAREKVNERSIEKDRKKVRDEKARQARQQAIQELQKKREEKRLAIQQVAEEEIRFLQANGKVGKKSNVKKGRTMQNSSTKKKVNIQQEPLQEGENQKETLQNNSPRPSLQNNTQDAASEGEADAQTFTLSDNRNRGGDAPRQEGDLSPLTASQVATKTTLDDLMETLKKLEEEEKFPGDKLDKNQTPQNWLDDLDRQTSDDEDFLTAERLKKLNPNKDNIKKSGYLTDEKMNSIMNFLDEVEVADRLSEIDHDLMKANEALERPALLVPSGEELAQLEQASVAAAEVTNTMLAQRLELEEKKRTVQMLQKALNQQRELTIRHAKETEKEMKKRIALQKEENEETVKRHLSFIDQLIDDKKELSEKCETFVKELKAVDKKYQTKIKAMQENHDLEMRKIKEMHAAAEKLRRERWIDEKTKKIKEMTVKGLEPEIQRLIAKHKDEVKKLKNIQEAELLAADERAAGRYVQMTEQLRNQLAQEKEAACARERELARQTYEKQLQQEEEAYQLQRRRLHAEVQEEKERLASQASRQRAELDRLQRQLEDSHSGASDAMRKEYEKAREEQEKRHVTEIRQLKEQLAVEKQAWEENYRKKQETWLLAKERELKEQVRKDRDKEIDMIITRLEEDSQAAREETERVAENRIKRIRDKYESEIAELERSERLTQEKYNQIKAKYAEVEGENERKTVTLKQKDKEIEELKKLLDDLNKERGRVSDVIRQEFADRLVGTDEENKRLKNEMSELKARHRIELQRAKDEVEVVIKSKEEEMAEVHKRVKSAIVKKEEVVSQLKQQYEAAVKRADHLEGLLEQQRKQILGKK